MAEQLFNTPEFNENLESLTGPSESLLFNLDFIGKADPMKEQEDLSFMEDKQAKSIFESLKPIEKEGKVSVFMDDSGRMYDADNPIVKQSLMMETLPDPPTEEEKARKAEEIRLRVEEEIGQLDFKATELIQLGGLSENRKQRYIDVNSERIKQEAKKEYDDYANGVAIDYAKKTPIEKDIISTINIKDQKLQAKIEETNNIIAGIDLSRFSTHPKDNINTELEKQFRETIDKYGTKTFEQFWNDFGKGKIEDGAVFRIEDAWGYKSNARTSTSTPIYWTAVTLPDGRKIVEKTGTGVAHPITGEVLGAEIPYKPITPFEINVKYYPIARYDEQVENINSDETLTQADKDKKLAELKTNREIGLKEVNSATVELINSPSISQEVKTAIIASSEPNNFKNAIASLSGGEDTGESFATKVLKAVATIPLGPALNVFTAAAPIEEGAGALSRMLQGREEAVLPTGTLALEIKKNPELAQYMDAVLKEAGERSGIYLNSIEGLANWVSAAKAKMNNKNIEATLSQIRNAAPKIIETMQMYNNTSKILETKISAFQVGALGIQNKSGYTAALRSYKNAYNELKNNDNKDIRDAFRFIKLQSYLLDKEATFSERYSELTADDLKFIETVGKDLQVNKRELLSTVYDKVEKLYALGNEAKSLYPEVELKQYEADNRPGIEQAIVEYRQATETLKGSEIFTEKGRTILGAINNLDEEYNSSLNDTSMYTFPVLTKDAAEMKNSLRLLDPMYGFSVGALNSISEIFGSVRETGQKLTGFVWDGFDANSRNIYYSLGEFKRYLETSGESGNYVFDISKQIGSALPQMAAFVGAFAAGGPLAGAGYLATTMTGPKMREAAAAGLDGMGQFVYTGLSIGIEFGSELVTSETALIKGLKGKSVLTKELVEKIMSPKSRMDGFKEYARAIWRRAGKTAADGGLEAFEEEIANKGNYLLQNMFNSMMNTSFKTNQFTLQESVDTLITMIGTTALFKGAVSLGRATAPRTMQQQAKKELIKKGFDKTDAAVMASLTSIDGVSRALDIVKKVETGEIKETELNMPVYEKMRDVMLPAAMSLQFSNDISIQQRVVAMDNLIKADTVKQMIESGQVTAEESTAALETYNANAQKALRDPEYAANEFGIDATEMKAMIFDAFNMGDISVNQSGALDARTPQQIQQAAEVAVDNTPIDRFGLINQLSNIYVVNEGNRALSKANQSEIQRNPEGFLATELQNAKNILEKVKVDYELASQQGPAPNELARIDNLNDKINELELIKSRYLKSQQNATQISERPQQEVGQPGDILQRPGTQEGQPQIREGERGFGQAAQQAADTRNRDFGSQAQQAVQEITALPEPTAAIQAYTTTINPGQEVQLMDELAQQVTEGEDMSVRALGQPVVDRVKQWIADTGYTAPVMAPFAEAAPMTVQQTMDIQAVEDARNGLISAITSSNKQSNTANKNAVKTLVDRLKQAFPNVKVIMDKKGFQDALKDEAARDLMTKGGVVYGRVLNGDVYLNPDYANYNTPIHEFGHLWLNAAKEIAPAVYNRGLELIRESEYMARLQADPLYQGLTTEEMENEALATAIGDRGEQFVNEAQKQGFKNWMRRLLRKMAQYVGIFNLSRVELDALTLDEFLNRANASLLAGEAVAFNKMSDRLAMFEVRVLHGSPYAFDKFTTQAIGTGEGNLSFGWGLYFTELSDIARRYAKEGQLRQLDDLIGDYQFDGEDIAQELLNIVQAGGEISDWIKRRESTLKNWKERIAAGEDLRGTTMENVVDRLEFAIKSAKEIQDKISRNVYDVTIHKGKQPSEYNWLEWDKPVDDSVKQKVNNAISLLQKKYNEANDKYVKYIRGLEVKYNKGRLTKLATQEELAKLKELSNLRNSISENQIPDIDINNIKDGQDLYFLLKDTFKSDKQASLFLLENGIDGIKYPAESISKGKTSETARGFNYVVFDENAVTIEQQTQFMARQQEPSFKSQMIDLANAVMQRELNKGRTLEEARNVAISEVSSAVISNSTGKYNSSAVQKQIQQFVGEAYNEQKKLEQASLRQRRISRAFTTPKTQAVVNAANQEALKIAEAKGTAKQAYEKVLAQVKAQIQAIYSGGVLPANVSWIDMMSLAPAIASDAVRAAFPASRTQQFEGEEMVNMTTSQWIRNAVSNQIRAIKDVKDRAKKIEAAVKNIFKEMAARYGRGLELSTSEVKAIVKDINDNVFSRADVMTAVENASIEISKVIEKAYRKKMLAETSNLMRKLKSKIDIAKYTGEYFNRASDIVKTDLSQLPNSDATLEDIVRLNNNLNGIIDGNLNLMVDTINLLGSITPSNSQIVVNEHKSLLAKIKSLIAKASANSVSDIDYKEMVRIQRAINDVKERKGNISALTPQQQAEIMQQYGILMLTDLANIDNYVAQREQDIQRETINLVSDIKNDLKSEFSDIRNKIPNAKLYDQFLKLMSSLSDKYLASLNPKQMFELSTALNDIAEYGNYNSYAYNEYIKAKRWAVRQNSLEWGINISAKRNKIATGGLSGVINNFKKFRRIFTDVEGGTPSAQNIANNLDLLKITSLDYELFSGFDDLNMGFLEKELFGPMVAAIDAAATKTQAGLAQLQKAMIALSDKSNHDVIKKAIGQILREYNVSDSVMMLSLKSKLRQGTSFSFISDISTRMAAIVGHQIDHISNLQEGQQPIDVILQRNIFNVKNAKSYLDITMKEYFTRGGVSFRSLESDQNAFMDAIAYAALTNGGTITLDGLKQDDLMNLLTEKQREGLGLWREHINNNLELFEAAQVINGSMKGSLNNYFPRKVLGTATITSIDNAEQYLNGQFENMGLEKGQLKSRVAEVGRLDLNANRVILNNLKALHLVIEVKPYLDYIKGLGDAIGDIAQNPEGINEFASAYLNGIDLALTERLNANLLNNERSINEDFGIVYRAIAGVQSLAARTWLISVSRQLFADYPANIGKTAAALAFENKKFGNQIMRLFSPRSSRYKTDKGTYKWDDYVEIAKATGSPIYKVMSVYADNFLYEYKKTPEELQRQQRVASWQDMAVKKQAWMSRFEESFKKITGEYLDHEAFKDERGVYRAANFDAVERAAAAADSFIDRQYGLPSFTRQPLRTQIFAPFVGRAFRNLFGTDKKKFSIAKNSPLTMITGFLQGYPSTQFQLYNSYMKLALSTTSGLSFTDRFAYFSRAILEGVLPSMVYTVFRTYMGVIFMGSAAAVYSAVDDDEDPRKVLNELETAQGWEKFLKRAKIAVAAKNKHILETLSNSIFSVSVDPQTSFFLRSALGHAAFLMYKEQAVEDLLTMNKAQRKKAIRIIREKEATWFNLYNVKPIEIYGGKDYDDAMRAFYDSQEPTKGWEDLVNSVSGIGVLHNLSTNVNDIRRYFAAAEKSTEVNSRETAIASGMLAYSYIFANMMLGGKFGFVMNMVSGDVRNIATFMLKEQKREVGEVERKEEKSNRSGFFMWIEKNGRGSRGGGRAGGTGRAGGAGRAGGGRAGGR